MSDEVENSKNELRQKSRRIEQLARQQVTYADVALRHANDDEPLQKQIKTSQETLISVGEQIDALKDKISAEQEPVREGLSQAQQAVIEAESEVERLMHQIEKKEQEIDSLSKMMSRQDIGIGDIVVPDPESKNKANGLRVEVAGLYTALGAAKSAQADAVLASDELATMSVYMPMEADPRMAELYRNMEAETTALSLLQGQVLGGTGTPTGSIFTNEENNIISMMAADTIKTSLPDFIESSVFRDAVQKTEAALTSTMPASVLNLMRDPRGITGNNRGLITRLTSTLDKIIDLPMLDDKQNTSFLRLVVSLIVDAIEEDNTLKSVLAEGTKKTGSSPARKTTKKPVIKPKSRGKKNEHGKKQ